MTPILFRTGMTGQTAALLAPRPALSAYWDRIKARPSFATAFGPAQSGATAACAILPGVLRAAWGGLTGRY
jgi:glutathione S-transferase